MGPDSENQHRSGLEVDPSVQPELVAAYVEDVVVVDDAHVRESLLHVSHIYRVQAPSHFNPFSENLSRESLYNTAEVALSRHFLHRPIY